MFFGNSPYLSPATAAASPPLFLPNRALSYSVALSVYPRNPTYSQVKPPGRLSVPSLSVPKRRIVNSYAAVDRNSLRIRTYESLDLNSPGMNTYGNQGGGYRLTGSASFAPISPLDLYSWKRTTNNYHRMILLQEMTAIQASSFPQMTASRRNPLGISTFRSYSSRKAARANRLRMILLQNYEINLSGMILLQKKRGGRGTQEISLPNLPRAYNRPAAQ
jgi:hypothetical protein